MTKARRSAIAKKAAATRRRNAAKKPTRRRRRSTAKRSALSEMFTPAAATGAAKLLVNGAAAGVVNEIVLDNVLSEVKSNNVKAMYKVAAAFGVATVLKAPYVGAGLMACATSDFLKSSGLAEGDYLQEYDYLSELEQQPLYLDADGHALSENGAYLQEGGDGSYQVAYAPDFWGYGAQ